MLLNILYPVTAMQINSY